ncbi:uncharacterized protein EV420DRAFT_1544608 [Desarmillaria tabescens]|uniref:SET domain-containing protein n=1 Tax=Armillaria tabescens TaxID=1929756 RepID=A0AA39N4W8_ARMTA|nr:uncharacterized protein EV420DRAFT_1544608 [Desarmillaria tabescens]KAK0458266.1 hypothetical protein EV420DRAFT_1544608 [Desarmillaria tabescens]
MTTPSRYEEDSDSDGEPLYLWSRSQTPEENFNDAEGADENGNWPLSIVSEEVGYDNQIRCIRWDTWSREDGTNNTYTEQDIPPTYLKSHTTRQRRKREKMARESRDIEIWTRLRAQAYEEKLAYTNDEPIPISDKLAALLFDKNVPPQKQPTPESSSEDSDGSGPSDGNDFEPDLPATPPPSSRLRNRMSNTPASSRSGYKLPGSAQRARSPTGKGKEKQASTSSYRLPSTSSTSTSTGEEGATRSLPHRSARRDGSLNLRKLSSASIRSPKTNITKTPRFPNVGCSTGSSRVTPIAQPLFTHDSVSQPLHTRSLSRRDVLQRIWTLEAAKAEAAPVTFVNEVDDEETPDLDKDFTYLEREYVRGAGAPDPVDDALLTICICRTCTYPSSCGCQADSEVKRVRQNGEEVQVFAYSQKGLFNFNVASHVAVIECNRLCRCDLSCINRVAQLTRQVPIEVFKTKKCGWGVRSSVDVERGKVLGLYTGPRTVANKASDQSYIFALDFTEDGSEPEEEGAYSVDSTLYGNWTRFLNHSCDPTLQIYQVVYDTIFEVFTVISLVAFDAGTEFTFDYCPSAAGKKRKGGNRCLCGASNCRGWLA